MTILVIFITALDGHQDYAALPREAADANAVISETLLGNEGGVETPNRRSLSAEDSESNTALKVLIKGVGNADKQLEKQVRKRRRLETLLLFKEDGLLRDNRSSLFPYPSEVDSGKGDGTDSAQRSIRRSLGKKTIRERLPTSGQVKARKIALEIQTQMARPEMGQERSPDGKVNAVDLSSTDSESQISRINLRLEEVPTATGINESPMMTNGHLPVTQIQMPNIDAADVAETKVSASSADGIPLVEDGIFWSRDVEQLVPEG